MRLFSIVILLCISLHASARVQVWEITDSVPRAVMNSGRTVLCYIYPGERFICDTVNFYGYTPRVEIHKENGYGGFIDKSNIRLSDDTTLFKINYPPELFCFSSDTSAYAQATFMNNGWGAIQLFMTLGDTFNVPVWTLRAYDGDTFAMRIFLKQGFGDVDAPGQFNFMKWKVINHWSDSAFASFLLYNWIHFYEDPSWQLCCEFISPFENDYRGWMNYMSIYYPMSYYLMKMESNDYRYYQRRHNALLPPRIIRKCMRMIRTGRIPRN